jgi:hypothetical protein
MEIAMALAEVINRNIGNPDAVISPELKVKEIGFSDYTD